jgi:endonuclease G
MIRHFSLISVLLLLLASCAGKGGSSAAAADGEYGLSAENSAASGKKLLELPYSIDENSETVEHMGYTVSYNNKERIPNWVAYALDKNELYDADWDRPNFTADPDIKGRQAYERDYIGQKDKNNLDRGHMAPAADMKWSSQAYEESFYLSNVCPQNHNLNAGDWNDLEKQVRREARYYGTVYVCAGPIIGKHKHGYIGEDKVTVPDAFFKALLAKRKDGSYAAIAFVMQNESGTHPLSSYAMTVDELEKMTGMDFFYNLDDKAQEEAESEYHAYEDWRVR